MQDCFFPSQQGEVEPQWVLGDASLAVTSQTSKSLGRSTQKWRVQRPGGLCGAPYGSSLGWGRPRPRPPSCWGRIHTCPPSVSEWPRSGHRSPLVTTAHREPRWEPVPPREREPEASSLCQRLFMHFIQLPLNAKCIRSPWSRDRNPGLGFAVPGSRAHPLGQFPASVE